MLGFVVWGLGFLGGFCSFDCILACGSFGRELVLWNGAAVRDDDEDDDGYDDNCDHRHNQLTMMIIIEL
jgi:hypothetical protein